MHHLKVLILAALLSCQGMLGAIPVKSFRSGQEIVLEKWEVVDIVFKATPPANPFEVSFGATVVDAQGNTSQIPGFFNGNNEWVLRFSSSLTGNLSFTTYASLQKLSGLHGKLNVNETSRVDKKGAVMIDPASPQHFIYEDGTPYFSILYELDWLFALDAQNTQDIPRTKQIIHDIAHNGFNQVVMNVYAWEAGWRKSDNVPAHYDYKQPEIFPWRGSNEHPDFSQLNVDFFKHLDRVIAHLDDQNIIAHLMIYVWNKKVNWPEMYSAADNMYFDYIIKRYQAFPNIIWDISKEALDYGRCDIPYVNERIARVRRLDAFNRLLTVHDYEYNSREHHRIDFISIQSWRTNLYNQMINAHSLHHDKPVVNIEHGGYEEGPYLSFEGNFVSAEQCLVRAYECVFAGVYPSYYWQNSAWDIIIYDALDEKQPYQPRYEYYRHMNNFFSRYDFNELFPVDQKITTNSRVENNNLSTAGLPLTNGTDKFLFFIPADTYQINTILPRPGGNQLQVIWFNIYTGEFTPATTTEWSGWGTFKSPWKDTDSVLIVEHLQ